MHPSSRGRRFAWCLLALLGVIPTTGCLGPHAIRVTRLKYNDVYRVTNDEQLLLNVVALRYADSPVFIDLSNITSQFEAAATGGYNSPVGGGVDPGLPGFGTSQLLLRDTPTLSYQPREGQDIGRTLVTPLTAELLRAVSPGGNTRQFLMMTVNDINDISNATLATSLIPGRPDDNERFREVIGLLVGLQERGAAELSIATFDATTYDPLPVGQVGGRDALQAAKDGYTFKTSSDQAILTKREKAVVLRVKGSEVNAPDVLELERSLGLRPGAGLYRIRSEQAEEEKVEDVLPSALGEDTIKLNMRSMLQIMTFLSKGVCVPPEHIEQGVAPVTPGHGEAVYDWKAVTRGLFAVRSQKHRPRDAEVAVRYRGYWFYIARDDVNTRASLALLEILLELQESEREQLGPLLTLPVGG